MNRRPHQLEALLLQLPSLAGLAFSFALWGGLSIGLSEWNWRNRPQLVLAPWRALVPAGGLAALALLWNPGKKRANLLALAGLVLCAWLFSLGMNTMAADSTVSSDPVIYSAAVVASPVATTYFSIAIGEKDFGQFLRSYPRLLPRLPEHARTHPPGPIIFFRAVSRLVNWSPGLQALVAGSIRSLTGFSSRELAQLFDEAFSKYHGLFYGYHPGFRLNHTPADALAAVLSGWLLCFSGALSLLPIWGLARLRYGERAAWWAVALFALVPSLSLFGIEVDQLVLLFSALTVYLAYAGWRRGRALLAAGAGFAFACAVFVSFGALALLPLLLIWTVLGLRNLSKDRQANLLALLGSMLVGAAVAVVGFYLVTDCNLLGIISAGLTAHRTGLAFARSYWKWALFDPVEFAAFLGLPLAIWALVALFRKPDAFGRRDSFLLAWAITFLLLDLSGIVRGEVGRIWLFLMFPPAICAAAFLSRQPRLPRATWGLLLAVLFFQTYQMKANLQLFSLF